jgi:hypothetical protein
LLLLRLLRVQVAPKRRTLALTHAEWHNNKQTRNRVRTQLMDTTTLGNDVQFQRRQYLKCRVLCSELAAFRLAQRNRKKYTT